MFDIATLTTAATIAIGVVTWVALTRILGAADPLELNAMFGQPWKPDWPRGVQEEEPFHWRLDRLEAIPATGLRLRAVAPVAGCEECAEEAAA